MKYLSNNFVRIFWLLKRLFASYFSHPGARASEARRRWESYAEFIKKAKNATPQLEVGDQQVTAQLKNPQLPETKRAELETKRDDLQSKLDLNKELLEAPSKRERDV